MELNEDDKNFIVDMLKSKGWELFTTWNTQQIEEYRRLATQPPGSVPEEMRTWYSALAAGREEAIHEPIQKIQELQ